MELARQLAFVASLAILSALASTVTTAQPAATDDALTGLWTSELSFAPGLSGELSVAQEKTTWHARIAGVDAACEVADGDVRCPFAHGQGEFRGWLSTGNRMLSGLWVQPFGTTAASREPVDPNPAFASPLRLKRDRSGAWRADVRPLDERFTLYLKIYRDAEGALVGAFRNPQRNSNGGASLFRVSREGDDKVVFSVRFDDNRPEMRHEATVLHSPERLRISWPDVSRDLELTRRAAEESPNFFARPPGERPYTYRKPVETGDGWTTARASQLGLDEAALTRIVQKVIDGDPAARRPALMHSLLVAYRGKLVLEEYFFGYGRDVPHDLRSAGKTFASVMLGAAQLHGTKIDPQTSIYQVVAKSGPFANPDPRKPQITLAHLMTHSSGLACDDNDDDSPGNEDTMQSQSAQPDWWKYTLDLPMAHDPGTRYAYCSANMNLVGAALTTATGTWLPEYFDASVARPLQFARYYWYLMPTGEGYLGGGVRLRSRDLLKVGQVYLDGGSWRGRRIVSASWVKESTARHMDVSPATTGLDEEQFSEAYSRGADGYAWHLLELKAGGRTFPAYDASGNGGQLLVVVPEAQLAVVFTGGNYRQGGIWARWPSDIVGGEIIPAIRQPLK